MQFSATSQYAIRIVSYMAVNERDLYTAKDLADDLGISYKYLTAIMTSLSKAGIIASTRGRGGGFTFKKPLEEISLKDVLAVTNPYDPDACIMGNGSCNSSNPCALHDAWAAPKAALSEMYDGTTLASIRQTKQGCRV